MKKFAVKDARGLTLGLYGRIASYTTLARELIGLNYARSPFAVFKYDEMTGLHITYDAKRTRVLSDAVVALRSGLAKHAKELIDP